MVEITMKLAALLSVLMVGPAGMAKADEYNIGVGIADITGPAAEIGMMGYAKQGQNTKGIHLRLYSRAYIFESPEDLTRVVYVSTDSGMMGQLVKLGVLRALEAMYPGVYTAQNVVLSSTHTHSGPAGFLQYILFDVTCLGFIKETKDAMVDGIVESIRRAHESMEPGKIYFNSGEVNDANINRSPTSYEANPEEERARYPYNTDREMFQLNLFSSTGRAMGVINWFAVHPTSMNNTNHFISGDNKGAASQMFERAINEEKGFLVGKGPFVAAFASTNLGDVSPNILGPKCMDTGLPCDLLHSTCDGRTQMCVASGPGKDMFESTQIIADRQFQKSYELFSDASSHIEVHGPVKFIHQFVDMTNYDVQMDDGTTVKTCKPAMGYSFAAGTTDGPGEFDFTQGTNNSNPFWDFITAFLKDPTPEQDACHAPKPILLDTGEYIFPYAWHPTIVDTQILSIGQVNLLAVPGEFTTMAGRRLRESVEKAVQEEGQQEVKAVIAGLSNTYTHYITTFEEYQRQRYEAASTIYGPHSLQAYQQQFVKMAHAMHQGELLPPGPPLPDLEDQQLSFVPGVLLDHAPVRTTFGQCIEQPGNARPGETVTARFVAGHLRNNPMLEESFLLVERWEGEDSWLPVASDAQWETRLQWERTNIVLGESEVTITWDIPQDIQEGSYRIRHMGYYRNAISGIHPYEGSSEVFEVSSNPFQRVRKPSSVQAPKWKPFDQFNKFFGNIKASLFM